MTRQCELVAMADAPRGDTVQLIATRWETEQIWARDALPATTAPKWGRPPRVTDPLRRRPFSFAPRAPKGFLYGSAARFQRVLLVSRLMRLCSLPPCRHRLPNLRKCLPHL